MTTSQPSSGDGLWWAAHVTVDLDAIAANVATLRTHAASADLMAVVKADGYGHGLIPSARAALRGGASWLATAQLGESLLLRGAGIDAPLLCWLYAPGADFESAIRADIDLGVSAAWTLVEIAAAARRVGSTARVHLKIDTGLGRNGIWMDDLPAILRSAEELQAEGVVQVVGVFSHFAYADAPGHPTVRTQQTVFEEAVAACERAGMPLEVRHLANSAATLTNPSATYDMVRPGLAIYGLSPIPEEASSAELGLRPAMTLESRVANVKSLPAGQGISYGHTYVTSAPTRVALLPVGYADGVPRAAGNCGPVWLNGARLSIAGRVCMDQVVLDVGPELEVRPGDVAVLFGTGHNGTPTAQNWADATGTISYEIVTRMSARLPRSFIGEE